MEDVDLLDEVDPLRGRSGAGPILRADFRKSLLILVFDAFADDFIGEPSFIGTGGGFSGDFCFGGVFCFMDGVLVDDLLGTLLFGLEDFDKLISLTRAAKVEISFFSGTSLRGETTLVSLLWLELSRLYRDEALEYLV